MGYVGAVSPTKIDAALVERVARARPGTSFVFVGPRPDRGAFAAVEQLRNAHFFDARPRERLPAVYTALDACLLPYRDSPMNRACSPLKVREALALGIPIISTLVAELAEHPGAATVCASDDELLSAIDAAGRGELRLDPAAARWFTDATWDVRAREFAELLDGLAAEDAR